MYGGEEAEDGEDGEEAEDGDDDDLVLVRDEEAREEEVEVGAEDSTSPDALVDAVTAEACAFTPSVYVNRRPGH